MALTSKRLAGAIAGALFLAAGAQTGMVDHAAAQTQWRLHGDQPVSFWWSEELQKFADDVGTRTDGALTVEFFPSASLGVAPGAILAPVASGNIEMAEFVASYVASEAPYLTVLGLPMLNGTVAEGREVMEEVREEQAAKLAEDYGVRVLATLTSTPLQLFLGDNEYENIESLQGLRIRTLGPDQEFFVRSLGAVPTNVPVTDLTTALASNSVDGIIAGTQFFLTQNFIDYGPNVLAWNAILGPGFLVIGESKWQSLDPDQQAAVTAAAEAFEDSVWTRATNFEEELQAQAKEAGFEISTLSDEDRARYVEKAREAWTNWAERGGPLSAELLDQATGNQN